MPEFAKMLPGPGNKNESVSTSVRKIDNGYVTRVSRSTDNEYTETETFSAERPVIGVAAADDARDKRPSSMAKAIATLNRRK